MATKVPPQFPSPFADGATPSRAYVRSPPEPYVKPCSNHAVHLQAEAPPFLRAFGNVTARHNRHQCKRYHRRHQDRDPDDGAAGIWCRRRAGVIAAGMTNDVPSEMLEPMRAMTPLGRYGSADDIANVCLYLASDESGFVSGQWLSPNGGLVI